MMLARRATGQLRALRRAASSSPARSELLTSTTHLPTWRADNASAFAPPICNKLLHKAELSVMGVGGPNTRTDFHLEAGAEFFWQLQGDMQLPIVERGKRRLVDIREGEVFLLPPRVPHSPQRTADSFGIVIERERAPDELDGLRWYTDFEKCDDILWERYFYCADLGRDLVPVVEAFRASEEHRTGVPGPDAVCVAPPLAQDVESSVPPPFRLSEWLDAHAEELARGETLDLFPPHAVPTSDLHVCVGGGPSHEAHAASAHETWLFSLRGETHVYAGVGGDATHVLTEGTCAIVPAGVAYTVKRAAGALGLVAARVAR